jgi:hypothetical protein
MILAGMEHGPCIEWGCAYFDPEAARDFDRSYKEYVLNQELAPLRSCLRCAKVVERYGEEVIGEIVFHVLGVISDKALHRWFHTWVSALKSTPILALENGRRDDVLRVTRQYEDPSFS